MRAVKEFAKNFVIGMVIVLSIMTVLAFSASRIGFDARSDLDLTTPVKPSALSLFLGPYYLPEKDVIYMPPTWFLTKLADDYDGVAIKVVLEDHGLPTDNNTVILFWYYHEDGHAIDFRASGLSPEEWAGPDARTTVLKAASSLEEAAFIYRQLPREVIADKYAISKLQ